MYLIFGLKVYCLILHPDNWYLLSSEYPYQAFPIGASALATSLQLWILQANIFKLNWPTKRRYSIIGLKSDSSSPHTYLNTLLKHYETKRHRRFQGSESVILASSVISQIDVGDLDSQRDDDFDDDDDRNTNVNGWDSPEEDVAQRDPTLVENVGVLTLLPCPSTRNCYISPHLCYWATICQSLSPLFRSLLSLVRCLFPLM